MNFVPALLANCGYSIVEQTRYRSDFDDVTHIASQSPSRTLVYKAVYSVSHGTVLLDPEMVVGIANDQRIMQFCTEHRTRAVVAIWERVSQSVIAREITPQGVQVDLIVVEGKAQKALNPPPSLLREPSPARLKEFLASGGAPLDEVFGTISAPILKLDEQATRRP
ncbi:MAG TPA: hypothetical protein VGP48_09005 [Stellaceae bacterium]|nr:hypothetical protein [Stellaceae bacterium]